MVPLTDESQLPAKYKWRASSMLNLYIRALRCVSRHLFSRNRAQSVHTVIHYPEHIKLVDQSFACTETRITVVIQSSRGDRVPAKLL